MEVKIEIITNIILISNIIIILIILIGEINRIIQRIGDIEIEIKIFNIKEASKNEGIGQIKTKGKIKICQGY